MGKIIWTDTSTGHLESIHRYISNDSKAYATRYIKSLIKSTEKLKIVPHCGRVVPELENTELREIIYRNHRIVYSVSGKNDNIRIVAVIHGACDMMSINTDEWNIN